MSIIRVELEQRERSPDYEGLKTVLLAAMRNPSKKDQPKIKVYISSKGPYPGTDIFVLWDEFEKIQYPERDELIRECWKEVKDINDPADKTVVGYTSEQAAKMNIDFDSQTVS